MLFTRISLLPTRADEGEARTGAVLARHEGDFRSEAEAPLSLDELLLLLGNGAEGDLRSREDAIACYLSAGEGWKEAMKLLGGTFAEGAAGLSEGKAD